MMPARTESPTQVQTPCAEAMSAIGRAKASGDSAKLARSASMKVTLSSPASAARLRASAMAPGMKSMPVTCQPGFAAATTQAFLPRPQPSSR
jgi:hypothetical protein